MKTWEWHKKRLLILSTIFNDLVSDNFSEKHFIIADKKTILTGLILTGSAAKTLKQVLTFWNEKIRILFGNVNVSAISLQLQCKCHCLNQIKFSLIQLQNLQFLLFNDVHFYTTSVFFYNDFIWGISWTTKYSELYILYFFLQKKITYLRT